MAQPAKFALFMGFSFERSVRTRTLRVTHDPLFAMYGFGPFTDGTLFAFDEINGFDLDVGTIGTHDGTRVTAFAFVAGDVPNNPQCFDFDTDFDEDIDLRDFANFTNCMTAPRQQEED